MVASNSTYKRTLASIERVGHRRIIDSRLGFELVVSLADADRGNHKSEALTLVSDNASNDFSLQRLLLDAIHISVLVGAGDEINSRRLAIDNGLMRLQARCKKRA